MKCQRWCKNGKRCPREAKHIAPNEHSCICTWHLNQPSQGDLAMVKAFRAAAARREVTRKPSPPTKRRIAIKVPWRDCKATFVRRSPDGRTVEVTEVDLDSLCWTAKIRIIGWTPKTKT